MKGTRVIDASTDIAGAFCGRLLGAMGASITVLEPAGGHPLRTAEPLLDDGSSALHGYLRAPDAVTVRSGGDLSELATEADVVLLSVDGNPGEVAAQAAALRERNPRLVVVITSPFGLTGPYASWRGGPLLDWASGGLASLNGEPDREPIPGGGPWASNLVGANAAFAAQAALLRARRSGAGDVVDVGSMGVLGCMHQWSISIYTHQGVTKRRHGNRHGEAHHPLALHPTQDGWVCIASVSAHQWEGLCITIDQPELLADDTLYSPAVRFDRADELDALINAWTSTLPSSEVVRILQENNCPAAAVRTTAENLADPHLAERRFWQPVAALGADARVPGPPFGLDVGQPVAGFSGLGQIGAGDLPLKGLRVLEFSVAWAGPLAGRLLGELGADVIKIEHPTSRGLSVVVSDDAQHDGWEWGTLPHPMIRNGVYPNGGPPGERWWNRLGYFNKVNRAKRSLCLDVKAPGGRQILEQLIAGADVLINNYSPRGVASLGIDHETLRSINPAIISVDLSGFGAVGPAAQQVSWGPILDATSGIAEATGYVDSGPYKQGLAFADAVGGIHGIAAVLTALAERDRTEAAVHVDVSQLETLLGMAGELAVVQSVTGRAPRRHGARSETFAPQGVYRCAGADEWLALSVTSDVEWLALVTMVGPPLARPEWDSVAARLADHDAIDAVLAAWFEGRAKFDATAELQAAGVRAMAVMTNADLAEDPHLAARDFLVTLDHEDCGPLRFPGFPVRFAATPTRHAPTPALGADNVAILTELGYSSSQIADLIATATVATVPPA